MKPTRLIDVSHTIEHGMVTYPGLPVPAISDWLSRDASQSRYAPGTTFQIGKIELLANTGTYIDAPFHRYDGRRDVADYPLEAVANLEGIVVRATERAGRALDAGVFRGRDVEGEAGRSEERRVGQECRSRWSPYHYKKNITPCAGSRVNRCI